jgi:hypothetical protein
VCRTRGIEKRGSEKKTFVLYELLLAFPKECTFEEVGGFFAKLVGKIGGILDPVAMPRSEDRIPWFLHWQYTEFKEPEFGSFGDVLEASGEVVWDESKEPVDYVSNVISSKDLMDSDLVDLTRRGGVARSEAEWWWGMRSITCAECNGAEEEKKKERKVWKMKRWVVQPLVMVMIIMRRVVIRKEEYDEYEECLVLTVELRLWKEGEERSGTERWDGGCVSITCAERQRSGAKVFKIRKLNLRPYILRPSFHYSNASENINFVYGMMADGRTSWSM